MPLMPLSDNLLTCVPRMLKVWEAANQLNMSRREDRDGAKEGPCKRKCFCAFNEKWCEDEEFGIWLCTLSPLSLRQVWGETCTCVLSASQKQKDLNKQQTPQITYCDRCLYVMLIFCTTWCVCSIQQSWSCRETMPPSEDDILSWLTFTLNWSEGNRIRSFTWWE